MKMKYEIRYLLIMCFSKMWYQFLIWNTLIKCVYFYKWMLSFRWGFTSMNNWEGESQEGENKKKGREFFLTLITYFEVDEELTYVGFYFKADDLLSIIFSLLPFPCDS